LSAPAITIDRKIPYANCFGGLATAEPMSIEAESTLSTDPRMVGDVTDHTDIYAIARTPSLIRLTNIPAATAAYTMIEQYGVTPCTGACIISPTGNNNQSSHVGYAASFFRLWNGDLNYIFDFVSTAKQTMKIAICWSPVKMTTYSTTVRQQQFFVQGSQKVSWNVPWEHINAAQLSGAPTGYNNPVDTGNYSNGYISIWLIQPISNALSGVAYPITYITYQQAGNSFKLIGPANNTTATSLQDGAGATDMEVLSGMYSEEKVCSFRELAKRHIYYGLVNPAGGNPVVVNISLTNLGLRAQYLLQKFTYFRGDLNSRFYYRGEATYPCMLNDEANLIGNMLFMDPSKSKEYEITSRFFRRLGYIPTNNGETTWSYVMAQFSGGDITAVPSYTIFTSFDDTLSLGLVRSSPVLIYAPKSAVAVKPNRFDANDPISAATVESSDVLKQKF